MSQTAIDILTAITLLTVKHTIADFFLQTPYQYRNKGRYGHPGGLLHAGVQAVFTTPVFLILPPASLALAALILFGEFLAHYHIDWLKENIVKWGNWTPQTHAFWYAIGIDQLAHYLTYVAIIAAILMY